MLLTLVLNHLITHNVTGDHLTGFALKLFEGGTFAV